MIHLSPAALIWQTAFQAPTISPINPSFFFTAHPPDLFTHPTVQNWRRAMTFRPRRDRGPEGRDFASASPDPGQLAEAVGPKSDRRRVRLRAAAPITPKVK